MKGLNDPDANGSDGLEPPPAQPPTVWGAPSRVGAFLEGLGIAGRVLGVVQEPRGTCAIGLAHAQAAGVVGVGHAGGAVAFAVDGMQRVVERPLVMAEQHAGGIPVVDLRAVVVVGVLRDQFPGIRLMVGVEVVVLPDQLVALVVLRDGRRVVLRARVSCRHCSNAAGRASVGRSGSRGARGRGRQRHCGRDVRATPRRRDCGHETRATGRRPCVGPSVGTECAGRQVAAGGRVVRDLYVSACDGEQADGCGVAGTGIRARGGVCRPAGAREAQRGVAGGMAG